MTPFPPEQIISSLHLRWARTWKNNGSLKLKFNTIILYILGCFFFLKINYFETDGPINYAAYSDTPIRVDPV